MGMGMPGIEGGGGPPFLANVWKKSICWNCSCICSCMRIGMGSCGFCSIATSCWTICGLNVGPSAGGGGGAVVVVVVVVVGSFKDVAGAAAAVVEGSLFGTGSGTGGAGAAVVLALAPVAANSETAA